MSFVFPFTLGSLLWRHDECWWLLKSQASRLFAQPFVQAQIKKNIRAPRHGPLCGEFTGDRWIPRTKGQQRRQCFHLMTSSCVQYSLIPSPISDISLESTSTCRRPHQHYQLPCTLWLLCYYHRFSWTKGIESKCRRFQELSRSWLKKLDIFIYRLPSRTPWVSQKRTVQYSDIIMRTMASQITSLTTVYSTVYSFTDQRKHQRSASLAFVWVTSEFPPQMASNAENALIWWRHHGSCWSV